MHVYASSVQNLTMYFIYLTPLNNVIEASLSALVGSANNNNKSNDTSLASNISFVVRFGI